MLAWHVPYLGWTRLPAEVSDFEITHFFSLRMEERNAMLSRYRHSLRIGAALQIGYVAHSMTHFTLSGKQEVFMNRNMRYICALVAIAGGAATWAMSAPDGLTRTELQRHDLSIQGREAIQTRVDFAPGAVAPWHSHPGEELVYVPEGRLEFQLQGETPVTLEAGGVLFIPAGKLHMARNPGTTRGIELATYFVEKGKPLLMRAEGASKP